jgi:hypothetical protein
MAAIEETSDQPRYALTRGPVFVDASGRRLRQVKLIGLGALGLVSGYVILLLVAFIGGPNIAAPYLPLPPAPAVPAARVLPPSPSPPASNAAGLPGREAEPAQPAAPAAFQAPVTAPSAVPVARPINGEGLQRAAPVASGSPPATSAEPASPGKSATAPGQTTRPSTPTHP